MFPDKTSRPVELIFFTFRSNVLATTVDIRAPNKSLNLEFFLRLPQSLSQPTLVSTTTGSPVKYPPPLTSTNPQFVEALRVTVGNFSDDAIAFSNLFRLHIFYDLVQLKHVGIEDYDS